MFKQSFYIFIFILLSQNLFAQNGIIQGRVLDKTTNEPLAFANIVIDGTTTGSVTDTSGNFSFACLTPGFVRLKASFIGYNPAMSSDIQVTNAKKIFLDIYLTI